MFIQRNFYSMFEALDSHKSEESRLKTFCLWPNTNHSSPETLAVAGFFYTGEGDTCQCIFCNLKLQNWRHGDDPWQMHKRYSTYCVLVRGEQCENVPLQKTKGLHRGTRKYTEVLMICIILRIDSQRFIRSGKKLRW